MQQRYAVSVEWNGVEYNGTYVIEDGRVRAFFRDREKDAELGGLRAYPEHVAEMLLREMVSGMPD